MKGKYCWAGARAGWRIEWSHRHRPVRWCYRYRRFGARGHRQAARARAPNPLRSSTAADTPAGMPSPCITQPRRVAAVFVSRFPHQYLFRLSSALARACFLFVTQRTCMTSSCGYILLHCIAPGSTLCVAFALCYCRFAGCNLQLKEFLNWDWNYLYI